MFVVDILIEIRSNSIEINDRENVPTIPLVSQATQISIASKFPRVWGESRLISH